MEIILNIFTDYITEIVIVITILNVLLILLYITSRIKISKITKKYNRLVEGTDAHSLEDMLLEHISEVRNVESELQGIKKQCESLDDRLKFSIQNIGFIRYNAFNNMGSDLSFSIALLDDNLDGFVITSIYGRDESKTYAKPIIKGSSTYALSVEEMQVLDRAKKHSVAL